MAFYGSSVANLSPILFRGNLFSEGVNIVFFTDVSYSMNLDSSSVSNYTSPRSSLGNISAGSTTSMFYDGIFPSTLQDELYTLKVGSQFQSSPNLYTYVDNTFRSKNFTQSLTINTETTTFPNHFIIADTNYFNERRFKNLWKNQYINIDEGVFNTSTLRYNITSKIAGESTATRFNSFDVTDNPGQYSEDVHGNVWSFYYSGSNNNSLSNITEGSVNTSYIGQFLNTPIRRNLPTYVIAASNEQENTASNLIGIGISTKNNVGYTTNKYDFNSSGFYVRRYRGYFLDDPDSPDPESSIENWFNTKAIPLPFGSTTTGLDEDAPGVNWFINGTNNSTATAAADLGGQPKIVYQGYIGGGTPVPDTDSSYADIQIPKSQITLATQNLSPSIQKGGFWGPIFEIDRLRSDIQNYTIMIVGYFAPQVTGSFTFRIQSTGTSCFWIGSDATGIEGFGPDSKVYSGYTVSNSTITCPDSKSARDNLLTGGDTDLNDVVSVTSASLNFTAGRYYPFRLILGNPSFGGNSFSPDGGLNFASSLINPSAVRLLFDVNTAAGTGTKENTYLLNGSGYFFGGEKVWEEGSLFFRPTVQTVTRTIEEEVKYRNLRVIGISGYESDDGYDAVFVRKPGQEYIYANLSKYSYTNFTTSANPPSTWRFANYFKPIEYSITDSTTGFTRQNNTITGDTTVGTGASFKIDKLNDRYILQVRPGFAGTDYRIGDKFTILASVLGEDNIENNLVVGITSVQPLEYTVTASLTDNFAERTTTNATFIVRKNEFNNNNYSLTLVNGGSNYESGDKLLISGTELDGTSANNITITVNTVLSGGTIDTFSVSGTPTNYIDYQVPLNSYYPKTANFLYEPVDITSIYYRKGTSIGIGYTAERITGIAYTTGSIIGLAQSSFTISGIAYTNITSSTTGIAYSTVNITGIGYTILSVTGAGFTHGNVTGIAYTTSTLSNIGFTSTGAVSIGYTAPNLVSIGYTAFEIASISYTGAYQIDQYDPANDECLITLDPLGPILPGNIGVGGKVLVRGTGEPALDSQTLSIINVLSDYVIEVSAPGLGAGGVQIPIDASLLIIQLDDAANNNVGFASEAILATQAPTTFVSGDSIIIRGITENSNWNSTFIVNSIVGENILRLDNTGRTELFTLEPGITFGFIGYNQSELELVIPVTSREVGITSIAYDLTAKSPDTANPYLIQSSFNQGGVSGGTANYTFTVGSGPGSNIDRYVQNGDIIYIFGTGSVFDYTNTGYGLTVTNVQDAGIGQDQITFRFATQGSDVPAIIPGYYIVNKLIPIVDAPSHGFSNGQLISISGNQNSVYNNTWQVAQAGINTFRLADSVTGIVFTAADLITTLGNTSNLSGIAAESVTEYKFGVGMGITVFGVTGQSAIYNDKYVISGIKSTSNGVPYAFILKENQTPSTLALQGSSGKIGIHTISGIATVTSTSSFGSVGSLISIKIQDSPSSFFNKTYTNARILDSTRILLGSDSFRNQTTPNPNEYASSSNANLNTIVGLVGDSLKVTHGTITPSGYTFVNGASIDIYGTTNFNGTYTINNVNGNILTLNTTSNSSTNFALRDTSGGIGVRGIGPVISFTNSYSFPAPYFGPNGSNIQVKLQDTGKTALNTNTARNARVISPTSILLTDNGLNPTDYSNPGAGGTIGLIGANYYITVSSGANSIPVGSTVGIQNVLDQNGNSLIADNLFTIQSNFGNDTGLIAIPSSSSSSTSSTNFGLRGNSGTLGLRANAVVTTSSNHPFINGDSVQIENTTGNLGIFNNTFTITYVSPTQFILNSTNSTQYTDDFTNANATGGIAGLENYPATVTSINHPFVTGQSVQIENTTNFNGSYTITKIDNNRFTLNGKTNPTSYTEISNSTTDPNGLITLKNAGPTVTYNGTPRIVGGTVVDLKTGDQVRIQNSTTFNGTYTVKRYTSTTFGITLTDPVSFTGINEGSGSIAGLVGSSIRIRSTSHGLTNGQSIRIQNTSTGFDNKLYTVTTVDSNLFDISNTVSTASTNFTITSTVGLIGYQNYPAIATFSNIIPSSFAVGSQIDIVNNDGTNTASSQQLSVPGPYTIAWRTDTGGLTRVGLQEAINPSNYSIVENNSGLGYTAGLRNSPATIRFNSTEFLNLTFDLPLNIGDIIPVSITGTDNFNGTYNTRYTSSNALELISPSTINPSDYSPNGDVSGVVGLANSDRVVRVSGGHGFTSADIGTTQVDIITGNVSLQDDFGGTYFISEILDTQNFALSGTQNPSGTISYTTADTEGYYVIFGRGPRVDSTFSFDGAFVYQQHLLDQGDGVTITNSSLSGFNGNRLALTVLSGTSFRLNGPYPSPINDINGRPDYKISGTLLYNQRAGLVNGNSNAGANLIIRRNATGVTSSYTIQSIVSAGSNYKTNELYLIPGLTLGGTTGTRNDALVKIGTVDVNGAIQSTSLSILKQTSNPTISVPDSSLDYESAKTASIVSGTGSGSQFRIVKRGIRNSSGITTYSTVELLNGGSSYNVNDVIRIPGNLLGGLAGDGTASNLRNDLLIYVEQTVSGGSISGTGFTFRGTSRDSAPLVNSGLSTIYLDGGVSRRSRPFGLEKVWDNVTDSGPPPNQGFLRQTHDMLTLAEANKGGVVKTDKVYTYGDIEKKAEIQELFFYSTSSVGHRLIGSPTSYRGSVIYDTLGNSGIATVIFDYDDDDDSIFLNISPNDTLYFITSLRSNPNLGVPDLDYRLINKGLKVINVNTNSNSPGNDPVNESAQTFNSFVLTNLPYLYGFNLDQLIIQTDNTTASISDNLAAGYEAIIINDDSILTVRSDNHPFVNGEIVTIRFNRLFDTTTYVEEGTGIAYTSYRVRNATTFSFQLENVSTGIGLTPSTIMPNGKKLIDYFAESYVPNTTVDLNRWTTSNRSQLYGDSNSWSKVGYPVIYSDVDVDGNTPSPSTDPGDTSRLTRSLLSIEGEAYKLIPGGKDPVDNRVGLAKLIAKVISDATQQK